MKLRDCSTCTWREPQNIYGRIDERCMRPQTSKIGTKRHNVSCVAETDSYPEPHRIDGDKCGVKRVHWSERA
jgi:hypothetical protein